MSRVRPPSDSPKTAVKSISRPNGPGVGVWEQDGETKTISSDQADRERALHCFLRSIMIAFAVLESIQAQSTSSCKRVTKIGGAPEELSKLIFCDTSSQAMGPTPPSSPSAIQLPSLGRLRNR